MVKKERKKRRRRKRILTVILIIAAIVVIGALVVVKVFTVQDVKVEGNKIYSAEKIENWVLNDEYSWNSLYVFFKYKLKDMEEIPFVDSMEVSLESPHVLHVEVYEKGLLGYVYISSVGKNAYLDKDGFVVELSSEVIPDTTKIAGLTVKKATLYEKLPLEKDAILKTLLNVSQLLKKYELNPDLIYVTDDDEVLLCYGNIQVNVGGNVYLNEKIVRLQQILPDIEGMVGTLHLEDWSESNTDIIFAKDELITIPNDVQTVPSTEISGEIGDGSSEDATVDSTTEGTGADSSPDEGEDDTGEN